MTTGSLQPSCELEADKMKTGRAEKWKEFTFLLTTKSWVGVNLATQMYSLTDA